MVDVRDVVVHIGIRKGIGGAASIEENGGNRKCRNASLTC